MLPKPPGHDPSKTPEFAAKWMIDEEYETAE
jgi:hypothetical protein